jgi:serine/threonine protein phosphatase PrpC
VVGKDQGIIKTDNIIIIKNMKFSVFQTSQIGGRKKNEDRMGYSYSKAAAIFLVADGLGGHPAGEVASQISLQVVMALFREQAQPRIADVAQFMHAAMLQVHQNLLEYAATHAMADTPSTTLVIAMIQDRKLYFGHCGDSRLYLIRDATIMAQTRDHSLLVRDGAGSTEAEIWSHSRHTLYSCLGASSAPIIELAEPVTLQFGDRFLLCSDGLWGSVDDSDIIHTLHTSEVADGTLSLVKLALRNGGPHGDNVTAVSVNWEEPDNHAPY